MNLTFPPSPHCQAPGRQPTPGSPDWLARLIIIKIFHLSSHLHSHTSPSLTMERVKPTWLIHLTIFIFTAQSDKLIWDLTNGGTVTPLSWDMLTNDRGEAPNQTQFARLILTLAKNKSHRSTKLGLTLHHFINPLTSSGGRSWPWSGPGLGVKFISLIKLKLRVSRLQHRTGLWKLYMPTQQNYLEVWLTDWSSSYYRIWPYLLISILVIATFANLFSLKNFNWLSGCL